MFTHNDLNSFHIAWNAFLNTVESNNDFKTYCNSTLYPALLEGVVKPNIKTGIKNWTNSNAESMNHTIKHAFDWKKVSLMQIITTLNKLVSSQLENIKRTLFGFGDFAFAPNWKIRRKQKSVGENVNKTATTKTEYVSRKKEGNDEKNEMFDERKIDHYP